jgi:hypothetical protein
MKTLILTFILVIMVTPATCFGEWEKVLENESGSITYVDFDSIIVATSLGMAREDDGDVYYWKLVDYANPVEGDMSAKVYTQGDCDQFRWKVLNSNAYSQAMGEGSPSSRIDEPDEDWTYASPDFIGEDTLKSVCNHVKSK